MNKKRASDIFVIKFHKFFESICVILCEKDNIHNFAIITIKLNL